MWKVLLLDDRETDCSTPLLEGLRSEGLAVDVLPSRKANEQEHAGWNAVVVPVSSPADFEVVARFHRFPREWALVLVMESADPELWAQAAREGAEMLVDRRAGKGALIGAVTSALKLRAESDLRILPLEHTCLCPVEKGAGMNQRFARSLGRILTSQGHTTIEAEEGSGGEILARWLHLVRGRTGPFLALDCDFLESDTAQQLFLGGAEWGAGYLSRCAGGTLLLRHAQHLPPATQAALTICLRNKEYVCPGSGTKVLVDLDVITLDAVNLADLASEGRYNRSLAAVLGEATVVLPPLRERSGDIPAMASSWAARCTRGCSIAPVTLKLIKEYLWPGNGWELWSVLEGCCNEVGKGGTVQPFHLPTALQRNRTASLEEEESLYTLPRLGCGHIPSLSDFREQARIQAERLYLLQVMEKAEGKVSEARQVAGLSKSSFYALLGKHSLLPERTAR